MNLFLIIAGGFVSWIALLIMLPLAIIKKTRIYGGIGLEICSAIFGIATLIVSAIVTYSYWGVAGVTIGFILAIGGIVPFSLVASALHSDWSNLFSIIMWLIYALSAGIGGAWFIARAAND